MPSREEQYPLGDDGLVVEKVGAWAKTKHKLLTDYIQASGGARSNYHIRSGAAYIDVFCGPGRLLIRDTKDYIDGSSVAAYRRGLTSPAAFSSIEISDWDAELLGATHARLRSLTAPVVATPGPAVEAMERIVRPGDSVLDVGSGSGILSMAAKLLGAARVIACDLDPEAAKVVPFFAGSVDAVNDGSPTSVRSRRDVRSAA